GLTEAQFNALVFKDDGVNPVIFDDDGRIFADIFGDGSDLVLGFAGPTLVLEEDGRIVKGFAMFNGASMVGSHRDELRAAMTHELGHLINLDHSQVNGHHITSVSGRLVGEGVPGFAGVPGEEDVETMHPLLVTAAMATLHADDRAALSALYPAPGFEPSTAAITGLVLDIDGSTPLLGVNVVARSVQRPFEEAYSCVSGFLADPAKPEALPAALRGAYELRGLTPGEAYRVYIEEVSQRFTLGASVGPLDPPLDLDPSQPAAFLELFNGVDESAENPPDDPLDAEALTLAPGATATRIDVVFNGVRPRVASIDPASGPYQKLTRVEITGANFIGVVSVLLRGPEGAAEEKTVRLTGVEVLDPSRLEAGVPAGMTPGTYVVIAATPRGQSEPGAVEFTVTEPPPVVAGTIPDAAENDRPRQVSVLGSHFLGAKAVRLTRAGLPDQELRILQVAAAGRIVVEVPAGILPGDFSVHVTNTAGESGPSATPFRVLELAPVLDVETDPAAARSSSSKQVRIRGSNLAGTTAVELLRGSETVSLRILSTSLDEVVVLVPRGLEPGTYTFRLTNTEGTSTGPAQFTVKKASGGGGGCAAGSAGGALPLEALGLLALVWARRRGRGHGKERHP
ncbi:MAG: hypothetical protein HY721_26230, partial [Planctomycetes bacterium]|nr:hypothetical protein [Planctomycetota bacterium]